MKKICIAGKNNIAVDVLDYCVKKYGIENVVCVANSNDKGIYGQWQKSVTYYCTNNGVQLISLEEAYLLENMVFLSLEFDKIVRTNKFKSKELYNIHFSYLPEYKGMYTSVLPILHGKEYAGVTFHKIRDGIDTGEIIEQRKILIDRNTTAYDLYKMFIKTGTDLVISCIEKVLLQEYTAKPQSSEKSSYYSKQEIDFSNVELQVKCTAYQIERQIRAFYFRPYQTMRYMNENIIDCVVTDVVSSEKCGTIIENTASYYLISTIDYNVYLYKDVQKELMDAIITHSNQKAKELCLTKKIINDEETVHGWTPIMIATYNNNVEMVSWLISNGAEVDAVNYNGTTLLMYAKDAYKRTGDNRLFVQLFNLGLDVNKKDYYGKKLADYLNDEGITLEELLGDN